MYTKEPELLPAIALAILGLLCVILAWTQEGWSFGLRVFFALVGGVFLIYAGTLSLRWAIFVLDEHALRAAKVRAITPEAEKIRLLSDLRPDQIELLMRQFVHVEVEPKIAGAEWSYNVDGTSIPGWFIKDFFEKVDREDGYLPAIGTWSEGSTGRRYAGVITGFYLKRGLALDAVGNRPARLKISVQDAMRWFDLIEEV